ncbi:VOC family protein [Subtercola frigoramans]|uniref:Enzyme related to lactoylglutathione lyase n=1 Tax=Subtercola frigoramans TaxID=120298 RepID=A0ABS2L4Q6_9MICO|nr:VOC family protein [Subtercola frigoramans]MBM7471725.1 putative enzyme related to lactoylglutathione lyase [Subtercola frigoramans]
MTLSWEELIVDCRDFSSLSKWWAEALGWEVVDEDEDGVELQNPDGSKPTLLFLNVPEQKSVKNRLHLDFVPDDQAAEVGRLVGLGATRLDIGQGEQSWVVLADPEGNEFCVLSARLTTAR